MSCLNGFIGLVAVMVALVAIFLPNLQRTADRFDVFKKLPKIPSGSASTCELVLGDVVPPKAGEKKVHNGAKWASSGFEDVVYIDSETAISCAGDLHALWFEGVEKARFSTCVLLKLPTQAGAYPLSIQKLRIMGYPEKNRLHAHGLFVRQSQGELRVFIVNHAYFAGGERIDAFALDTDALTLTFAGAVRSPVLDLEHNGILNDVYVVNDEELFVTSYLSTRDNRKGRTVKETFAEKISHAKFVLQGLTETSDTKMLRCKYTLQLNENEPGVSTCEPVVTGLMLANGVQGVRLPGTRDDHLVFLNDVFNKTVYMYVFSKGELIPSGSLRLVHATDNIEIDPKVTSKGAASGSGIEIGITAYAGSIISIMKASAVDHSDKASPGGSSRVDIRVVCQIDVSTECEIIEVDQSDLVIHDGTKLQGTASSLVLYHKRYAEEPPSSRDQQGVVVMGSYKKPGLMVCTMPRY